MKNLIILSSILIFLGIIYLGNSYKENEALLSEEPQSTTEILQPSGLTKDHDIVFGISNGNEFSQSSNIFHDKNYSTEDNWIYEIDSLSNESLEAIALQSSQFHYESFRDSINFENAYLSSSIEVVSECDGDISYLVDIAINENHAGLLTFRKSHDDDERMKIELGSIEPGPAAYLMDEEKNQATDNSILDIESARDIVINKSGSYPDYVGAIYPCLINSQGEDLSSPVPMYKFMAQDAVYLVNVHSGIAIEKNELDRLQNIENGIAINQHGSDSFDADISQDELSQLLANDNPEIRVDALQSINETAVLIGLLDDPSSEIKEQIIEIISEKEDAPIYSDNISALLDSQEIESSVYMAIYDYFEVHYGSNKEVMNDVVNRIIEATSSQEVIDYISET